MKISLFVVGKTTDPRIASLIDEYQQRLKHYIPFEFVVIPDLKNAKALTEEQVKKETARCLGCGATIVDPNQCVGCGLCTTRCEFDAIHLKRDFPEASTMRKSEDKLKYILPNGLKQAIKVRVKPKKKEDWE